MARENSKQDLKNEKYYKKLKTDIGNFKTKNKAPIDKGKKYSSTTGRKVYKK